MLDGISGHSLFWGKSGYVGCRREVCSGSQIAPAYGLRDSRAGTEKRKDERDRRNTPSKWTRTQNPVLKRNILVADFGLGGGETGSAERRWEGPAAVRSGAARSIPPAGTRSESPFDPSICIWLAMISYEVRLLPDWSCHCRLRIEPSM